MLLFVIIFTSSVLTPGLAQTGNVAMSAYSNAVANAGGLGLISAFSSSSSFPSFFYRYGWVRSCTYDICTPTCSERNPWYANSICPENSNPCNCPPGTVISEKGGVCVPEQTCDRYINCNGDYNARKSNCPFSCPATCARPNNAQSCKTQCGPPGCECKFGYILSHLGGKCIKPEQCPNGDPCGRNSSFVPCLVECPDLYCSKTEYQVACGPKQVCPPGCACARGYIRKSVEDHTCILKSECPPGKCSRPNEEWNNCVHTCFSDTCEDKKTMQKGCSIPTFYCAPRCLCKEGFYRNDKNTCIPEKSCPVQSE